jgi:hypothetical protein
MDFRESSRVINMKIKNNAPDYNYLIEEIHTDLSIFDVPLGWDGISKIKIIQYNSIGSHEFWLESLKNWDYKKNARWINEKVLMTLKWLKENHPELLI